MKHVGIKVGILTFVGSFTTIIGLILYTLFTFGHVFPYDWAINSVCLMLMTPYYPDRKYYNRLCGVCIACCFGKYKNVALALKEQQLSAANKTASTRDDDATNTITTKSPSSIQSADMEPLEVSKNLTVDTNITLQTNDDDDDGD